VGEAAIEGGVMRRSEVAVAALLLWTAMPVAAQTPPAIIDVKPAIVVKVPSAALGTEQVATVLLPEGYPKSRSRYPVLYLLHGGGQDHTAFAARPWFEALLSRDMIIGDAECRR
jgi:dipeptidyl aminopeptidase/acylaminoacyl peptidase